MHQNGLRLETRVRTRDADVVVEGLFASDVSGPSHFAFVPFGVLHPRERSRRGGEERVRLLGFVGVRLRVGGERERARARGSRRGRRRRQRPFPHDPRAVMPGETPRVQRRVRRRANPHRARGAFRVEQRVAKRVQIVRDGALVHGVEGGAE